METSYLDQTIAKEEIDFFIAELTSLNKITKRYVRSLRQEYLMDRELDFTYLIKRPPYDIKITLPLNAPLSELRYLNCPSGILKELREYPNLEELYCQDNELQEIPFYPKLKKLRCGRNNLTEIKEYPELEELFCGQMDIEKISHFPKLKSLMCPENKLTEVGEFLNLVNLTCPGNSLTKIGNCPNLEWLICENNFHSEKIKMPYFPLLRKLDLSNSQINKSNKNYHQYKKSDLDKRYFTRDQYSSVDLDL